MKIFLCKKTTTTTTKISIISRPALKNNEGYFYKLKKMTQKKSWDFWSN